MIYFGHPVNVYGTRLEAELLARIAEAWPGRKICNPAEPQHEVGYARIRELRGNGMLYFLEEVLPTCAEGVFLPFRDGAWGAGVFQEALALALACKPVSQIDHFGVVRPVNLPLVRFLSIDETRARIRDADRKPLPY